MSKNKFIQRLMCISLEAKDFLAISQILMAVHTVVEGYFRELNSRNENNVYVGYT